jgi:hypothetical protein
MLPAIVVKVLAKCMLKSIYFNPDAMAEDGKGMKGRYHAG